MTSEESYFSETKADVSEFQWCQFVTILTFKKPSRAVGWNLKPEKRDLIPILFVYKNLNWEK